MLPKQLFYLTNDQLCAYQWRRGRLTAGRKFGADRSGLEAFARYLAEHANTPTYILADMVEEDFQRHSLPHVRGRAGRHLVERRLAQAYRDTPFRHAAFQGRDPDGRRDDHVLFSALTNAALVQPWLALLEQRKTPLAAIYSSAWLSSLLVQKLGMVQDHLLLITHQTGGLRQSYFQGRHLKFSRLTELDVQDDVAASIMAETARMQQFLSSTRLIDRGATLRVVILAPADGLAQLEAACDDGPEIAFHFIDMDTAAERLRLEAVPRLADQLLLAIIGKRAPATQYPLQAQGRFHRLWRARLLFNGASATLVTVAALLVAADLFRTAGHASTAARMHEEARAFDTRYGAIMATLPPTITRTANMKAAVQVERLLGVQGPAPGTLVALVSHSLERAPAIRLTALDWHVEQSGTAAPAADAPLALGEADGEAPAPIPAAAVGVPRPPPQVLRIEGEIELAQSDYRSILGTMNQFALDMGSNPKMSVEVVEPPLDVRQNVTLSGTTGLAEAQDKPKFVLKVMWKP